MDAVDPTQGPSNGAAGSFRLSPILKVVSNQHRFPDEHGRYFPVFIATPPAHADTHTLKWKHSSMKMAACCKAPPPVFVSCTPLWLPVSCHSSVCVPVRPAGRPVFPLPSNACHANSIPFARWPPGSQKEMPPLAQRHALGMLWVSFFKNVQLCLQQKITEMGLVWQRRAETFIQ